MKDKLYIIFQADGVLNNIYTDEKLHWDWLNVQGMLELIFLTKEYFDVKCIMLSKCNSIAQLKEDLRTKALANKLINKIRGNICYSGNPKEIEHYLKTQKEGKVLIFNHKIDYPYAIFWNLSATYGLTPYDAKIINRELREKFIC